MTNLTDKWKKGELPSGWYWVKGVRAEGIYAYTSEYLNNIDRPADGEKIVEKVPSYEQWQAKLEENTKLKELLKEDKIQLNVKTQIITGFKKLLKRTRKYLSEQETPHSLIKSIDEVLGEE